MVYKGTQELETDRFILRRFKMSDAHDIYFNWSSEGAAKYNAWKVHSSKMDQGISQ